MKELRTGLYPGGRLKNGAAILAAAETVDVSLAQKRFDEFGVEHLAYMAYMGAHGEVRTAKAAEDAARQMEADLIPYTKLQARLRTARAARAAAADGAPGLYPALFGHLTPPKKKKDKAAKQAATDKAATPAAANTEVKTS